MTPGASTPFTATLASEWTKLTSLRSTWVMLVLAITLSVTMTVLISIVVGETWDDWSAADRATYDPALLGFSGTILGAIVFAVLGVRGIASEYSTGMMRLTLTATPRRGRVLLAKAAVLAAITLVAATVANVVMFGAAQAILGSYGLDTARLWESDPLRGLIAMGAVAPVLPLIAFSLAVLTRSTAGAITSVLAFIFVPDIVGSLLPPTWQDAVLVYLPGVAADSIVALEEELVRLDLGVAIAVLAAWVLAFLAAAHLRLSRSDA